MISGKDLSFQIFKQAGFRAYLLGRVFTTLAIQLQMTVIGLQIYYEYVRSAYYLGLLGLAEAIPFILASFFSGYLADLKNKKKIILVCCFLLSVCSGLLLLISTHKLNFLNALFYWPIFAVVMVIGIIRSFTAATMMPFLAELLNREYYTRSATWNSTVWHVSSVTGPIVAAWLYGYLHSAVVIHIFNAILFLLGMSCFSIVPYIHRITVKGSEGIFESLKEGIQFVWRQPIIFSAITLDLFAVLFGGAVAILPAFNDKILHAGPEMFGLLRTAPAMGAILMGIWLTFHPPGRLAGKAMLLSVGLFGVFTIILGFCTNFWLAFAMLVLTGAFDNISVVVRQSILQLMTPNKMRGRVSAVNSVFIGSSNEIGAFESGLAARFLGLANSIVFGGVMTVLVVLGIVRKAPALKKLDLRKIATVDTEGK